MTNPQSPNADPLIVAKWFCKAYYEAFNKDPASLHKMYAENSSYTYGWQGNEADERFVGHEAIKNKLSSTELGCVKALTVVTSQESVGGGIMVVAAGSWEPSLVKKGANVCRPFVQTFFLVNDSPGQYSIKNDIFYILQIEPPTFPSVDVQETKDSAEKNTSQSESSSPSSSSLIFHSERTSSQGEYLPSRTVASPAWGLVSFCKQGSSAQQTQTNKPHNHNHTHLL
uniref:NTF2 domain-containing protein n=1 Tax=Paramoeba aestuarina TaxID=180227 RepID=A0A7S4L5C4_9EUKA